jgi:MFS family permease
MGWLQVCTPRHASCQAKKLPPCFPCTVTEMQPRLMDCHVVVAAALMVGLMLSAPAAAMLSKRVNSLRLIGAGLACWIAGTAASGLAPTFPLLLAARLLVGTGSGPFIAVAAPLIGAKGLFMFAAFVQPFCCLVPHLLNPTLAVLCGMM